MEIKEGGMRDYLKDCSIQNTLKNVRYYIFLQFICRYFDDIREEKKDIE